MVRQMIESVPRRHRQQVAGIQRKTIHARRSCLLFADIGASIQKGITPSQAEPWKVSTCKPSGTSGAIDAAGTGQCANSRSFQRCLISQRPEGNGRGLCDVRIRYSSMA